MPEQELCDRVRLLLAQMACTQGEFAARIGLDDSKLSRSLSGARRFTVRELVRITEVAGVSADWLLSGNGLGPGDTSPLESWPGVPPPTEPVASGERDRGGEAIAAWAQRRDEFLAAAWRLIAERGYHAVRVADIARLCGTSSAAVHYYFPGKQDVLNAALRYCVERAFARQSAQLRAIADARQRMLRLIDMQLPRPGRLRDEWSIWLQFWAEATLRRELRSVHNEYYARWRETVVSIIARGQRQGVFRADVDATECAIRFTALTDGIAIQLLTGAPDMTVERMQRVLVDFVVRELDAPRDDAPRDDAPRDDAPHGVDGDR
jgi:AcrR family transcriptional regulator